MKRNSAKCNDIQEFFPMTKIKVLHCVDNIFHSPTYNSVKKSQACRFGHDFQESRPQMPTACPQGNCDVGFHHNNNISSNSSFSVQWPQMVLHVNIDPFVEYVASDDVEDALFSRAEDNPAASQHHPHTASLASPTLRLPVKYSSSACSLPRIASTTLLRLLVESSRASTTQQPPGFCIVDCRYPYEFEAGHIRHAVNLYTHEHVRKYLFERRHENKFQHYCTPPLAAATMAAQVSTEKGGFSNNSIVTRNSLTTMERQLQRNTFMIIFHCEFSSNRGPNLARYLRELDRNANLMNYPHLDFPEIYILDGGYKQFYNTIQKNVDLGHVTSSAAEQWFCPDRNYCEMHSKRFANEKALFARIAKNSCAQASKKNNRAFYGENMSPSSSTN